MTTNVRKNDGKISIEQNDEKKEKHSPFELIPLLDVGDA